MADRLGRFGEQEAAPRDRAIGALVWLHLVSGSTAERELIRTATDAEDFLWEAACSGALYGLPEWITATLSPGVAEASPELSRALRDIEASIKERQVPAPQRPGGRADLSEAEVLELLEGIDPKGRDDGWRSVRSEVPIVMRTKEDEAAGLLLGLYVDTGDPSQEKEVLPIGAAQTMSKDFLGGIEDGHRAALALLEQLGLDGILLSKLRPIVVCGLGLRDPPSGEGPPLRGRSAGLPVALTVLRRASELDGDTLPPMRCAATGCLTPDGRLEPMAMDAKALKLNAVQADGWFQELLCPPSLVSEAPGEAPDGLCTATDLRSAAEAMWGESWTSWRESLYQRSEPRKNLLEAIGKSFRERLASKPSKAIEPARVLREVIHEKSTRSISDAPAEARKAMGSKASAEAAATASQLDEPRATRFPVAEIDSWESWEALSRQTRSASDVETEGQQERGAARERVWDPFGVDERHALLTGGSSEDRARLLERHIDTWLQEAYRAGSVKVPLLVDAPILSTELGSKGDGEDLIRALAAILKVDLRRPDGEYLHKAFDQGRLVLGLEGWELLSGGAAGPLKTALSRLVERGNNLVLACQAPEAAALGAVFPGTHTRNRLQGLSSDQVKTHVLAELDVRADAFLALLERDSRLAELAKTPALLRLLCRAVNDLRHPTQMTCARLLEDALRFALPEDGRDLHPFAAAVAAVSSSDEMPARISSEHLREALRQRCSEQVPPRPDGCDGLIRKLLDSAVLIEEHDGDGAVALRFGHPALQTASVAIHLAGLPPDQRWDELRIDERLRPQRELLIELCCGIAGDPEEIVNRLLEDPVDPWAIKLLRAANCLREAGQAPAETTASVISRLSGALAEPRPLAERRYLADALASLVEAGIAGAAEATGRAIDDSKLQHPVVTRLAVSLNRTGDRRGLARLMDMAQGGPIGPAAAALDALGEQDSSNALLLLEGMLVSRRCDPRLLLRTSALEGADQAALSRLADLLRESMVTVPVRQALATAIASIPAAQGIALAAASDRRVPWSVRAAAATRLAMDFPLPPSLGGLVQSPNLTWEWRARLLTAMIKSGDTEALDEVATVLNLPLGSTDRSALIKAVAAAPGGKKYLLSHVEQGGSDWTKYTEILVALVDSGDRDAIGVAGGLVADGSVSASLCTQVIQALAAQCERVWIAPALRLVKDPAVDWDQRIGLAISLIEEGVRAEALLRDLLALEEELTSLDGCAELIRSYWAAHESCGPVAEMLEDESLAPDLRAEIAAAYCWAAKSTSEMPLPDAVVTLLQDDQLDRWHKGLLATSLARSGRPEHREAALEASLGAGLLELRVYRGLIRDVMLDPLSRPLSEELGDRLHAALAVPPDEEQIRLDAETRQELEARVGARVALCSPLEDTRVFERHVDEGDDALSFEILDRMVPYYQAIVRDEYADLLAERDGVVPVTDGVSASHPVIEESHPLDIEGFKTWSKILTLQPDSRDLSRAFLSGMGSASTELEVWLESEELEWPEEAAHRFLLAKVRRERIERAYQSALKDSHLQRTLRNRLEVGDGRGLLDVAGMLALLSQSGENDEANGGEAPVYFYAAIGAAIHGSSGLAIELIERCAWVLSQFDTEMRTTMALEGIATIGEVETLHGLDDNACMQALRMRLHAVSE